MRWTGDRERTADHGRSQVRRKLQLMRRNRSDRLLNGFGTQTNGAVTPQPTVLQSMLKLLDHDAGFRLLRNHVHLIHVMHMWS